MLNLHSDTLEALYLDGIVQSTHISYANDLAADRKQLVKTWPATEEEKMRTAVVMAAFLRASARARLLRFLADEPAAQQRSPGTSDDRLKMQVRGCSALDMVNLEFTSIGTHGINLIEGVWRVTSDPLQKHPNKLLAQALPRDFNISLLDSDRGTSRPPSVRDLSEVFSIAATICGEAPEAQDYGAPVANALSDPAVRRLLAAEVELPDAAAFQRYLSSPRPHHMAMGGATPRALANSFVFSLSDGEPIRSAAFALLTAARVLGCQVSQDTNASEHGGDSGTRYKWLSLPSEIRRACLEHLPGCFWLPGEGTFSRATISRIISFATDRRTIAYGALPEATFLELRLASEANQPPEPDARILDEPKWSFEAAKRRWRPLDSRSMGTAMMMKGVDISWEAECFLRAVGVAEDFLKLFDDIFDMRCQFNGLYRDLNAPPP